VRSMLSSDIPGAERWVKHKLGKEDVSQYWDEVSELLNRYGIDDQKELREGYQCVDVHKRRFSAVTLFGKREITALSADMNDEEGNSIPMRRWLSVCFEATEEEDLLSYMRSANLLLVLQCVDLCLRIRLCDVSRATSMRCFPILSGYPGWVYCLKHPEESLADRFLTPLLRFFLFKEYDALCTLPQDILRVPISAELVRFIRRPDSDINPSVNEKAQESQFDFTCFPTLYTARLLLREVTLDDVKGVQSCRGDFEVVQHNSGIVLSSDADIRSFISSMIEQYSSKQALRWGIVLRSEAGVEEGRSGEVCGMVGFNYWDRGDRRASVGLELRRSLWGHGYMSEALRAVLEFGYTAMGLNRIEAVVSAYNDRCINMLTGLGFVVEGRQREQYYEHGSFHDVILLALLKREWKR